ncbi:MAG: hypothetical protein WCA39_16095 [Nitrososphaeraceae archaeon]
MSRITDCPKCNGQKRIPINGLAGFDEYFLIEVVFSQQPATFAMEKVE